MASAFSSMGSMPRAIQVLLWSNVGLFLADFLTGGAFVKYWLALDPYRTVHDLQVWRLFTYMFVHDLRVPFFHLLLNMLILWMFGVPLVQTMGEKKFYWFYFSCGTFAGVCSIIFYSLTNNPTIIIGASGAIFGLMFAFARFFPTQQFLMFFIFPVEARYAVLIIGAIELLAITSNDGIAHITHLSGAVFAWFFFRFEDRGLEWIAGWKGRKAAREVKAQRQAEEKKEQAMVDIDPILKKISSTGINSLTNEEKEKLQKASEAKRKQRSNIISFDDYKKEK